MMRSTCTRQLAFLLILAGLARAESLTIDIGDAPMKSAKALGAGSKSATPGTVADRIVRFDKLLPGERYDVTLTPPDGKQLRLIDLSWHSDAAPASPNPEALSDDDKAEITSIVKEIKSFMNKNDIVQLVGNADRAAAIVELTRDTDFHARAGDEIIWRVEVWYFENQAGGWAKVQQQNRVIERVRFKTRTEYDKTRTSMQWIGIEKGLHIVRGEDARVILPKQG